jgi:hypothetical protein
VVVESKQVDLFPCTLVFLDDEAPASPNLRHKDPLSYLRQAVGLNRSLLRAGMPLLNIFTNRPASIRSLLASIPEPSRPVIHELQTTLTVPRQTAFYAAHFKLDLLDQVSGLLPPDTLLLLLDTDVMAIRPLDHDMLERCAEAGVGAFDISDQVFPPYGPARVIEALELVAGRHLLNPRWYGGEFLLATPAFLRRLVPRAREFYPTYVRMIDRLWHNGDETFISAALNTLADEGQEIVETGAYQAIGRHWAGNTHRDLRWFRSCSFVHLPSGKKLLERESRFVDFDAHRFWRRVGQAHLVGRVRLAVKRLGRS